MFSVNRIFCTWSVTITLVINLLKSKMEGNIWTEFINLRYLIKFILFVLAAYYILTQARFNISESEVFSVNGIFLYLLLIDLYSIIVPIRWSVYRTLSNSNGKLLKSEILEIRPQITPSFAGRPIECRNIDDENGSYIPGGRTFICCGAICQWAIPATRNKGTRETLGESNPCRNIDPRRAASTSC